MRHLRKGRKFGRERDQRKALMKSLASSFFVSGKIKTTEAKAKELRPFAEKIITRAKNPTLSNKRIVGSMISQQAAKKVFELGEQYKERPGGYTRITKLGRRHGDAAKMAVIELIK